MNNKQLIIDNCFPFPFSLFPQNYQLRITNYELFKIGLFLGLVLQRLVDCGRSF